MTLTVRKISEFIKLCTIFQSIRNLNETKFFKYLSRLRRKNRKIIYFPILKQRLVANFIFTASDQSCMSNIFVALKLPVGPSK